MIKNRCCTKLDPMVGLEHTFVLEPLLSSFYIDYLASVLE